MEIKRKIRWKFGIAGLVIAASGVAAIGTDLYRALTVEKPKYSQERLDTRAKLSRLESDSKILDIHIKAHYPIAVNPDIIDYNNSRARILSINKSSIESTSQKLYRLEDCNILLTRYDKSILPSGYSVSGLILLGLGGLGFDISRKNALTNKELIPS